VGLEDVILMCQYWQYEVPEFGLLAHWKLDEVEGSEATNGTGDPKYDADLHGDPVWQPSGGVLDGALLFDGVNDSIEAPSVVNPADGPFSVVAWVKTDTPGKTIVSQTGTYGVSWLGIDDAGRLVTRLQGSGRGATPLPPGTVITDNEWHRVGFVWDGQYRMLYVDDVEVVKDTNLQGVGGSDGALNIGVDKSLSNDSYFSGLIDDVRIHDRVVEP
jgi:hypothetical protein